MSNKWKIIKNDEQAKQEQRICFYCKRYFCTVYQGQRCSGILPQLETLSGLMRQVSELDTCKKFATDKAFKNRTK